MRKWETPFSSPVAEVGYPRLHRQAEDLSARLRERQSAGEKSLLPTPSGGRLQFFRIGWIEPGKILYLREKSSGGQEQDQGLIVGLL